MGSQTPTASQNRGYFRKDSEGSAKGVPSWSVCLHRDRKKKPLKALSAAVGACPELSNVQDCKVNKSDRLLLIGAHVALLGAGRQQLHQTYQRFAPGQASAQKI